jgi:hypothetical protein
MDDMVLRDCQGLASPELHTSRRIRLVFDLLAEFLAKQAL